MYELREDFDYTCPRCGSIWSVSLYGGVDYTEFTDLCPNCDPQEFRFMNPDMN